MRAQRVPGVVLVREQEQPELVQERALVLARVPEQEPLVRVVLV